MVISKNGKSQNKVALAEEIGYGNDIIMSKMGRDVNENKNKKLKIIEKSSVEGWMGGWMYGCKSHFKDCLLQSKIISKTKFQNNGNLKR